MVVKIRRHEAHRSVVREDSQQVTVQRIWLGRRIGEPPPRALVNVEVVGQLP